MKRRQFLKAAALSAGAAAFPTIVPATALGKNGAVAANDRIVMGFIGLGGMGTGNLNGFLGKSDAHVVAVCDVDTDHRNEAKEMIDRKYGNQDCETYNDFRELLDRDDLDAICNATPDHWHAIVSTRAARKGLDIYQEKPLGYTIAEGRAILDAVEKYGIVFQTGSQQRSSSNFRFACELVRNGRIGQVDMVKVGLPSKSSIRDVGVEFTKPPEGFDYDMWLGPAPKVPYSPGRCHWNFRWISDYSGGQLTDWAGHHIDIAQWGMDSEMTAPIEIEGTGVFPSGDTILYDTMESYEFDCKYKKGFTIKVMDRDRHPRGMGVIFEGTEGWVYVTRGEIDAHPKSLLRSTIGPNEVHLYESNDHRQNFLDCVRTRQEPIAPARVSHRSIMVAHLGLTAIKMGQKLYWDPEKEQYVNNPEANRYLSRAMRSPWKL